MITDRAVSKRVAGVDETSEAVREHANHADEEEEASLSGHHESQDSQPPLYTPKDQFRSSLSSYPTTVSKANPLPIHSDSLTNTMNFLSDLQKISNSSSETHLPEEKNDQNQNQQQHHQPSNAELMASAKVLAEAGQTTISQGAGKVDKARVAGAAGDLLGAASSYGKLEEKSYGKYVEKAETYLDQYGNPSSQSKSHSNTTTTTTPNHSSTPSTTTDSEPHSAAAAGDHESEGNTESGTGDYVKMAQGFLKK